MSIKMRDQEKIMRPSPERNLRYEEYKKIVNDCISNVKLKYYQDIFDNKKNSVKLL